MERELLSMGIDTSNYKTSLAVVDKTGEVLFNYQEFLDVKPGEKVFGSRKLFFSMFKSSRKQLRRHLNMRTFEKT